MKTISIEELKQIQIEIMQSVHDFCQTHQLRYSLAYGTLLGAVRHKGFIPWDDDIDILMPRADYERFRAEFKHPYYKMYDFRSDPEYALPYGKVADTRTLLKENTEIMDLGIDIDIFPIDNLFNTEEECFAFIESQTPLKRKFRMKMLRPSPKNVWWKRIAIRLSKLLVLNTSLREVTRQRYQAIDQLTDDHSRYVAMVAGQEYGNRATRALFLRETFDHYVELPFEDRHFMAIADYDRHLTAIYGDYMTPPPPGQRTSPHTLNEIYWL